MRDMHLQVIISPNLIENYSPFKKLSIEKNQQIKSKIGTLTTLDCKVNQRKSG